MAPIQTFMFMHFKCDYDDSESLTEVGFLAVERSRLLQPKNTEEPSTKKIFPLRDNGFTLEIYDEIADFMNKQPKPVCLVSHNGHIFDFLVLKRELERLKKTEKLEAERLEAEKLEAEKLKKAEKLETEGLEKAEKLEAERLKKSEKLGAEGLKTERLEDASADKRLRNWFEDVLCADSLYIFYDISKSGKVNHSGDDLSEVKDSQEDPQHLFDDVKDEENNKPLIEEPADERLKYTRKAVRKIFFDDDPKPPLGYYELPAIYGREVGSPIKHNFTAKDINMLFRISLKYGKEFLAWTDDIQYEFAKVNANNVRI